MSSHSLTENETEGNTLTLRERAENARERAHRYAAAQAEAAAAADDRKARAIARRLLVERFGVEPEREGRDTVWAGELEFIGLSPREFDDYFDEELRLIGDCPVCGTRVTGAKDLLDLATLGEQLERFQPAAWHTCRNPEYLGTLPTRSAEERLCDALVDLLWARGLVLTGDE